MTEKSIHSTVIGMTIPEGQIGFVDEASFLKRDVMKQIANVLTPLDLVVDAFAGVGISTKIYAESGAEVFAIDHDKEMFEMLTKNTAGIKNVTLCNCDNVLSMTELKNAGMSVSAVDLDPFSNAYVQLPFAVNILARAGILCITSGEQISFRCGQRLKSRYGKYSNAIRKNNKYYLFAEKVLIPYIANTFNLEPVYHYVFPTSSRAVFVKGKKYRDKLKRVFRDYPRYIGYLRKLEEKK